MESARKKSSKVLKKSALYRLKILIFTEAIVKNHPVPMEFVGVKDSFGGSGEPEELMQKFGLTWKEIYASALIAMHRRDKGSLPDIRKIKDVAEYAG